jgi:hypothetical protein
MRFIRLLGAVVVFYGLSYIVYGLRQFFGMVDYHADTYIIELNLSIGVITFVTGIGLILAKEWARIAWLAAATVLLAQHIYFLGVTFMDDLDPTVQILNVILITLLFFIGWSKLTTASVKQYFR